MCVCEPPQAGHRCHGLSWIGLWWWWWWWHRAAAAAAAEQVHAVPGPAPCGDTVGGLFFIIVAGHQSAPPLVGQATRGERALALAGVECAAGPHEHFPQVRIVLASGTKGAQPRKHAHGCLCLHIIAARHRQASCQPSASGADNEQSSCSGEPLADICHQSNWAAQA